MELGRPWRVRLNLRPLLAKSWVTAPVQAASTVYGRGTGMRSEGRPVMVAYVSSS